MPGLFASGVRKRYRADFDRPGAPNRNAIVPREIKLGADEPLDIFAKPASDQLHAIAEAEDEPAAGQAAINLCAKGGYHFYPSKR